MAKHPSDKHRLCPMCNGKNLLGSRSKSLCQKCKGYRNALAKAYHGVPNLQIMAEDKIKTGCEECGYGKGDIEKSPALAYDHLDPSLKEFMMSDISNNNTERFLNLFKNERSKCRILCANCHNIHTVYQRQEGKEKRLLEASEYFANIQHRELPMKLKTYLYTYLNMKQEPPTQMELQL